MRGASLDERVDDNGKRGFRDILALLGRCCTPLDTDFLDHIKRHVRSIAADGALKKVAGVVRADALPHAAMIQRDRAHFVRIACRDPLARIGTFERHHARLFGKRSLRRNAQFSDARHSRASLPEPQSARVPPPSP